MGQTVGVQLLGPTTLIVDGQLVELGSVRQRRLLAALALDVGTVVSADRLADRVWADGELPDDPRRALRTNLTRLRQAIGDVEAIATEPSGWRLDDAQVELDTQRFDQLVSAAAEPGIDVHGRLARLDEALALWRGGAYEDMVGEDWVRAESTRLEELKLTAVERRYDAMLAAGMHTDALPGLAGEVDANPLRDRLVGLQMLALYRSGRQAEATRVYEQHRRHLADELGLEPGAKLHELDSRIVAGDPSLHITSTAGTPLRSYRLGEQLGEGAFAVVYRGTQPSVGRDVAVKVIRADLANRPEFVRRFEAEAHLVARLEHPYIVPLYDYWREPDRACLVLRYLRGGTLEARLTSGGPLSLDACATMVEQIGSALATAHAEGVVHRDVKPANVFLDEVGNFYLGDFGIALEAAEVSDPTAALSAGSPAYASPEQLRREPVGPPADVHGLAISIYESLTGRLPFPAAASQAELLQHQLHDPIPDVRERRGEVPAAVDAVIQRATAKLPADRYQTVEDLMAEFEAALQADQVSAVVRPGSATVITTAEARNPYKGLRAFTEADSGDFHGRERLVDRLLALMSQTGTAGRIAAVVGPSGIGKSSVVRAGLLPALRQDGVATSASWFVATMLPGSNPFDELAAALLRVATHAPDNMMGMLTDDRRGIARVVKALVPDDDGSDVLLVIDQFEELFTLTAQADTVRFLDALEHAVTDTRCPLRVVLTMRADFWDRPLRHGAFARLIDASTVNVTALAPDELERAIVAPAHHFGVEFEPGLVSEIVADVNDQPGALPLLQYALTELWERQVAGVLTRDAYRELGGVTGALARRAEELYVESTPDEQQAARRLIGRLVTLGEGTEDVRRRAIENEVGDDDATASVIDRFGRARLFSFDRDPSTREPTLEVAHEALIREWPRLRSWLDDDRDGLRIHRHLTETATAWLANDRDAGELYRGARLDTAATWAGEHRAEFNPLEQEFFDASVTAHEVELAAERDRFDQQLRSNRRLRVLVAVATVIALVAAGAGVFALQQRERADEKTEEAQARAAEAEEARSDADDARRQADASAEEARKQESAANASADSEQAVRRDSDVRRMVAEAVDLVDTDPRLAVLVALEALRAGPSTATLGGLQRVMTQLPAGWITNIDHDWTPSAAAFTAEGELVTFDGEVVPVWDIERREVVRTIGHETPQAITMSGDGRRLLVSGAAGWAVYATGSWDVVLQGEHTAVTGIALDHEGERVALGFSTGAITVLDGDGRVQMNGSVDNPDRPAELLEFDPNGQLLAVSSGDFGRAEVWDIAGGARLTGGLWAGSSTTLGGAGAMAWWNGALWIAEQSKLVGYDSSGSLVAEPIGLPTAFVGGPMLVSPDNELLLGFADGSFYQVDEQLALSLALESPSGELDAAAISTSGDVVALGAHGIDLFTFTGQAGLARRRLEADGDTVRLTESGSTLVNQNTPAIRPARLLDLTSVDETWHELATPAGINAWVFPLEEEEALFFLGKRPDESTVVGVWVNGQIAELTDYVDQGGGWSAIAVSPDGQRIVTLLTHGSDPVAAVLVLDADTGTIVERLDIPLPEAFDGNVLRGLDAEFSPDGTRLIVATVAETVHTFRTDDWSEVTPSLDSENGFADLVFSRDGAVALTLSSKGLEVRDGETLARVRGPATGLVAGASLGGQRVDFIVDERYAVVSGGGSGSQIVDLETLQPVGDPFQMDTAFRQAAVARDGNLLATVVDDEVIVWNVDIDAWPELACRTVGRNMTPDEWADVGPFNETYHATCPEWPDGQ